MVEIDWALVFSAMRRYSDLGYVEIATPWIVDYETAMITCPADARLTELETGESLVGSAEQGFLELVIANQLPEGDKFVSAGPCFRRENVFDDLHKPYFFKVELFARVDFEQEGNIVVQDFITHAQRFFKSVSGLDVSRIETDVGVDLEINNIEIGSYGVRHHPSVGWWVYGTGLALPRFKQAIKC